MLNFQSDVTKRYDLNEKKLVALMKGSTKLLKSKVANSEVADLVEELISEKRAEMAVTFKEKAKALINSKMAFNKFIREKEKEFEKAVSEKLKEFNTEMETLFGLVENIDSLQKEYEYTLTQGSDFHVTGTNITFTGSTDNPTSTDLTSE